MSYKKGDIMKTEKLFKITGALCLIGSLLNGADLSQRGPIPFEIFDANKDGYVSKNEFYDARAKRQSLKVNQGMPMKNVANAPEFSLLDQNKDGKLTKLELLEGQNTQMQKNRSNKGMGQGMGQGQGNMQGNTQRNMPTFESFDLDDNGYLSESEKNEARGNRMGRNSTPFSEIDTNNDGKVSKEEFLKNQLKKRTPLR